MPKAASYCGMPLDHNGRCRTSETVAAHYRKNAKHAQEIRAIRQAWLNAYKLERGCERCGYREHPRALDFDHIEPALKIRGIADMLTASWEKLLAELEKCRTLCANCHRIVTHDAQAEALLQGDKRASGLDERITSQAAAHTVHLYTTSPR